MKKIIVLAIASCLSFTITAQKLVIKGSDTVLPLSQKEAESYMKANSGSGITVIGGGSGVGVAALMDGTTDIAMSSRKLKMDERLKLQDAGKAYREVIVANDALSIIVHPGNKVSQLTREQVEAIYTGKIKNWKEVGGEDLTIVVYSRESSSGTYEFFKENVMMRKNYAPTVLNMPATGAIIQSVSQTKGAIGYVGLAYMNKEVKDLAISYDKGKTFVPASLENAKNKTYPIVRPLFYFYPTAKEALVKPFINFILSAEGQKLVQQVGYIPIK
ncbi:MAG: phosphate ABC transporter substrate-binding protein [Bacteroidia bacterium]|nr:phosphate ABC transporter substrate-binding protein [Bacteroidia bacterium]